MSLRTLDFEATDSGMDEQGHFKITLLPNGDDRFLKHAFHFKDIELLFDETGIGVNYDLDVDLASHQLPETLSKEKQQEIKDFGDQLLNKFISDLIEVIQNGLDHSSNECHHTQCCHEK